MFKTIIVSMLLLQACTTFNKSNKFKSNEVMNFDTTTNTGLPGTGIRFSPATKYTKSELEVLAVSERLSNELVQSKCFENFMVNRKLIQTKGRSGKEVVDHLKSTNLTVPVVMYYRPNNVVGYRQPPSKTIYTNRKFHAGATACSRASNLTHEWSHSAGYTHAFRASYDRPRSVPYSINAAMIECCSCKGIMDCKVKD